MESFSINNTESFRQLYSRYYKALMLYAMKMTEDEETAEDIVQNVFLHLWENREIFDDENVVRNFLYLSVRRRAIDPPDTSRWKGNTRSMPWETTRRQRLHGRTARPSRARYTADSWKPSTSCHPDSERFSCTICKARKTPR